jgi:predicted regulator of Ras-like GTPase activity (Roadblock/LC7/MglB family)
MDSMAMGKRAIPAMEKLAERLPQLHCAVLCTADGFNVCSIGVSETQLGKLAALSGSLFTMGAATLASLGDEGQAPAPPAAAVAPGPAAPTPIMPLPGSAARAPQASELGELGVLTLEASGSIIVAVQVPHASQTLVLLIAAHQTPLGVLHLRARQSAGELAELFGARPGGSRPRGVD